MTGVDNIYYNIGENYDADVFKQEILKLYQEREKIRLIFDLDGQSINIAAMKKIKKVFKEIGVSGLEETCIIVKPGFKKTLIKNFLKIVKTEKPVKFL